MIASLQMYDWPEIQGNIDAFWQIAHAALAEGGIKAGARLARPHDISHPWTWPDLLISQTCGLPLIAGTCGAAVPFARPLYDVEGCGSGTYRSAIIAREPAPITAFSGARIAANGRDSQSGYNALVDHVQKHVTHRAAFFERVMITGAHRASADAVADGRADLCALDAVAWALYRQVAPIRAARLHVIAWSEACPAPPFITAPAHVELIPQLRSALTRAAEQAPSCIALPTEILPASVDDYRPIRAMADRVAGMAITPQDPPDHAKA